MRIVLSLFAAVAVIVFLSACGTAEPVPDFDFKPSESDKLTQQEYRELIWHARHFVAKSKNLRIDDVARQIIRDTDPKVQLKYFAEKYGQIRMVWRLNHESVLELSGTGKMIADEFPWKLQIKVLQESHPIPERLKKNLPSPAF